MKRLVYRSGRHFLQIPGPTNVPDRVLRAIDAPTIDHRGPAFAELGLEVLEGLREVSSTNPRPPAVCPARLVPPPRATTGTPSRAAMVTAAATSSASRGNATPIGSMLYRLASVE